MSCWNAVKSKATEMNALQETRKTEGKLAITSVQYVRVNGQTNGFATGGDGPLHHVLGEGTVALHVELEPDGTLRVLCDLIDRGRRERADHKARAACACSARRSKLAFPVIKAMIGNRRQQHGMLVLNSEKLNAHVRMRNIDEHIRR